MSFKEKLEWAKGEAFPHLLVLSICVAGMLVALILRPVEPQAIWLAKKKDEQVSVGQHRLPEICIMKRSTGLPCPGCGLTRSWVSLAHGLWQHSVAHHRIGWMIFGYALLQILRHGFWLLVSTWRTRLGRIGRLLDYGLIPLGVILVVNWVWNLAQMFNSTN